MTSRSAVSPHQPRPSHRVAARRIGAGLLAVALVTTGAACTQDDGAPAASSGPGAGGDTASLEPAVTVEVGASPTVELLDAGEGARRVLEYAPSIEPTVVDVTRSGSSRAVVPGSEPTTDDTPQQTLTVEGSSEPDVDGAQRAAVTVLDFTSVDQQRAAQFATADGFTVTWTRSADGVVSRYSLAAPSGATDAARAGVEITANAIADATVAWPTEEIGVGARWTVTSVVDDAVAPERVVTYELVELEGDLATVELTVEAPAVSDTLTAPPPDGGDEEITLDVETYEVGGSGELTVDLRAALPVEGSTESSTRAVYTHPETGARTTYDEGSRLEFSTGD